MLACRPVIADIGKPELYAWGLCFALQVGLLGLMILRRSYVTFPTFTAYLAANVAQSIADFFIFRYWGFNSRVAFAAAWSIGAVLVLLCAAAVLEICRQVFAEYRGIWAFIWRTLVISIGLVAILSITLSKRGFEYGILYSDRAVGLGEAVAIVALLAFARYYRVHSQGPIRFLAIGFFLYSCFQVVNDTLLEALPKAYSPLWNLLGTVAFTCSVLVWGWGLRGKSAQPATAPAMLPAGIYHELSPEVNRRLGMLNDRLVQFSKRKVRRP
jgi:hypothetical protein